MSGTTISRRGFLGGAAAFAAMPPLAASAENHAPGSARRGEESRCELIGRRDGAAELVKPEDYAAYLRDGKTRGFEALKSLELAFEKVMREAREAVVTGDAPAVWGVYNMGYVVKTRRSLFAIDLKHRRGKEFAPLLDFALVTHNHDDHLQRDFYEAMDSAGKTVVSNFLENKGASECGYTPGERTLKIKDVEIRTFRVDHSRAAWGIDFTTAFEMSMGGYSIFHSGDCCSAEKFRLTRREHDLWMFHPRCGMKPVDGAKAVNPKLSVVAHLSELGHAKNRWRWSWADGEDARRGLVNAGYKAVVPFWGDRIV